MSKKERVKAEESTAVVKAKNGVSLIGSVASAGLGTAQNIDAAVDAIFHDIATDVMEFDKGRLLLSAVGKKLTLENMKIKAGFYRDKTKQGFLTA